MRKELFKYKGTTIDLKKILDVMNETIIIVDNDKVSYVNNHASNLFGYSKEEIVGLEFKDLTSEYETKPSFLKDVASSSLDSFNPSKRFNWIFKKQDGTSIGTEVIMIPYQSIEGIQKVLIINDLSEWSNYKKAIEVDRNLYNALFNDGDKMMFLIDGESGSVVAANKRAEEFYEMDFSVTNYNIFNLEVLNDFDFKTDIQNTLNGEKHHLILKHRTSKGKIVDISVIAGPIELDGESLVYALLEPLEFMEESYDTSSEGSYQQFFDIHPEAMVICDTNYLITDVNNAFVNQFKFSKSEVKGKGIDELITPLEYIEESHFFAEILKKGGKVSQEVIRKDRLNQTKVYNLTASSFTEDGEINGYMAVYEDVDEIHQSMNKLKLIEKVYDNVEEGMVITDSKVRIMWVNKAFETMTGFKNKEVTGLNPKILNSGKHDEVYFENMWHEINTGSQWSGEIVNRKKDGTVYNEWLNIFAIRNDQGVVTNYIGIMNDITKFKSQEERIKYLAYRDSLTGLYNRAFFMDEFDDILEGMNEREDLLALLYFDIDDFKMINDTMGHGFGDEVLKVFAQRLRSLVDQRDIIARLGGDEFVIMLRNFEEINTPLKVAKRIISAFEDPVVIEGHHIELRSSIGIVVYPYDGDNKNQLMKNVDIAMYEAKKSNQTNVVYFSKALEEQVEEKYLIDKYIKGAVKYDELSLRYQGIVNASDQRLASAEVLVRWDNPILGSVSPGVFIPIAEKNGTILELGHWVLKHSISKYSQWNKEGIAPKKMAINVSVIQLESEQFYKSVLGILDQYDIDPNVLEFEITETVYMKNIDKIVETLQKLSELGISIVMDDFGTGYSSLSKLKMLKLSKLKIDRAFIYDLEDNSDDVELTSTIISMAKNLSLQVVAEGVESEHQLNFLKAERCDYIQGYLFYRPVDEEKFEELLRLEKRKLEELNEWS